MFVSELTLHDPHHVFDQFRAGMVGAFALGDATAETPGTQPNGTVVASAKKRLWPALHGDEEITTDRSGHVVVFLATAHPLRSRRRMHAMIRTLTRAKFTSQQGLVMLDVGSAWARLSGDECIDDERIRAVIEGAERSLDAGDVMRGVRRRQSVGATLGRPSIAGMGVPRFMLAPPEWQH